MASTILISALLAGAVAAILVRLHHNRKQGKHICGGDCGACGGNCSAHSKPAP